MSDELVLKDRLAVRNLELTRRALATGEYGEAYLDLDAELFAKYFAGDTDALLSQAWYDQPVWTSFMSRVRPGDRVLCLAGGGGQQSAIYSLLGASVTVLDLTPEQLERDRLAARHYGYDVETIQGDMRDLSALADDTFHWVHQPISLLYVEDLHEVCDGVQRVMKRGGRYYSDYTYPGFHMAQDMGWDGDGYRLRIGQPHRSGPMLEREDNDLLNFEHGVSFGECNHLLSDIVNGQVAAGLAIIGLWENPRHEHVQSVAKLQPGSPEHRHCFIPFGVTTVSEKT